MTKAYGLSRIDEVYVTESHPIPMVTIYLQVKGANVVEQSTEAIQFLYPDFENFQYDVKREELTQPPAGDMAFLYDTFHDACGFERLCNNYSSHVGAAINAIDKGGLNDQCESCSCDSACAANEDCCIDLIIEKMPYTCIDEPRLLTIEHSITDFKPDEGASMTVIGRCLNRDDTDLIDRCETDNFDRTDILQYMPVFQNGVYKNIYCLMCNIHTPEPVFKVKVICNNYLETALSKTMTQLFEVVRKHCKVQVVPPGYDRHCSTRKQLVDNPSIISSCNQTGLWFNYDERIAAGCEDDGHSTLSFMPIYTVHLSDGTMFFKNFLCFLCNPRESQVTYDSCNEDNQLDTICQETKLVPSWLPYKNVYCYLCNLPPAPFYTFQQTNNLPTPADMNMQMSVELGSTYRMLFALSQEEWSDFYPDGSDPNPVCSLGFSYDYTAVKYHFCHFCKIKFIHFATSLRK